MKFLSITLVAFMAMVSGEQVISEPKVYARDEIPKEAVIEGGDSPFNEYEVYDFDRERYEIRLRNEEEAKKVAAEMKAEQEKAKEFSTKKYQDIKAELNSIDDFEERNHRMMAHFRKSLISGDEYILQELRNDGNSEMCEYVYDDKETILTIASCWLKSTHLTKFAFDMGCETSRDIIQRVITETRMEDLLFIHMEEGGADMAPFYFSAVKAKDYASITTILGTGFDPDTWHEDRDTVDIAVSRNDLELLKFLIEHGVNVNGMDTRLIKAVEHNNTEMVQYLLDTGLVEGLDEHSLFMAVVLGNSDMVTALLESGVSYKSKHLDKAIEKGRFRIVPALFDQAPATVSNAQMAAAVSQSALTTEHRESPVASEPRQIVEYLLNRGGSANCADPEGTPCLLLAVAGGDVYVVDLLLEKGADKGATNSKGETAVDVAIINGHENLAQFLVRASLGPPPVQEQQSGSGASPKQEL